MNLITSTELRTKTPKVIEILLNGGTISIIHRSRVVGEIRPKIEESVKRINGSRLQKKINALSLPRLTLKEIDRRYRSAMMKKHGQGLS